jgi:putative ATPase
MEARLFPQGEDKANESGRGLTPLADRMRPRSLEEFVGQDHLVGPGSLLRRAIESDQVPSMILWGPPGSGKTTLASLVARLTRGEFVRLSAVAAGVKDLRQVVKEARERRRREKLKTILFVDEIHRWNKAQQDGFLPYVEDGTIILIGATTENPSFYVISALLSRCRVFTLNQLTPEDVASLLRRALADGERGVGALGARFTDEAITLLAESCDGDARRALNDLEIVARAAAEEGKEDEVTAEYVQEALRTRSFVYDKEGEEHYNLISALHKSVRGSDPDAALYWLARMLAAGEEPLYVARRLVRMAVEDIGLASPQALPLAIAATECYRFLGSPEGELALAEVAVYLATCPKSNSIEAAYIAVRKEVSESGSKPVPLFLRNAPTGLMKELGYGKDYQYDHDHTDAFAPQDYFPEGVKQRQFYRPTGRGFEKEIEKRLEAWASLRKKSRRGERPDGGTGEGPRPGKEAPES